MSRDDGFAIGDRSTRTLYDVRLVRAVRQVGLAAVVAWDAIVDASWEAGRRVTLEDAVDTLPFALVEGPLDPIRDALFAQGLLDEAGCVTDHTWDRWFGVAAERREATRKRSRDYNARRRGDTDQGSSDVNATSTRRRDDVRAPKHHATVPTVPTVPTVSARPRARESGTPRAVAEIMPRDPDTGLVTFAGVEGKA